MNKITLESIAAQAANLIVPQDGTEGTNLANYDCQKAVLAALVAVWDKHNPPKGD